MRPRSNPIDRQVAEMHLDERLHHSREATGKLIAVGQKKVSSAFNNLWADLEARREAAQRKRAEENAARSSTSSSVTDASQSASIAKGLKSPDLSNAQANLQAAGTRAGAYLSSWGQWASEKKKGWGRSANSTPVNSPPPSAGPRTGDLKRVEEWKREMNSRTNRSSGILSPGLSSPGPVTPGPPMTPGAFGGVEKEKEGASGLGEGEAKVEEKKGGEGKAEEKRESLFFDAEKEKPGASTSSS